MTKITGLNRLKGKKGTYLCFYLEVVFGDVVSVRQKDPCSLCELNCLLYSFSEQTQFSKGTYLQKNPDWELHQNHNREKHVHVHRENNTKSDLKDFALNSVL